MTDRDESGKAGVVEPAVDQRFRVIEGAGPPRPDFDALFTAHYAFVHRALSSMGAPPAALDDLAQDVFIVVHRKLAEYDARQDFRSWVWGIARRVLRTHGRTRARADRKLRALPSPEPASAPDEQFERKERAALAAELLAAMPEAQRKVFVMVEVEGMSAPAVASATDLPLNTVYSRLRTAREKFSKGLARHRAKMRREFRA